MAFEPYETCIVDKYPYNYRGYIMGGRTHGKTTETVLQEIMEWHPELLFDKFVYKNAKTKVIIGCAEHGYFEKYPNDMKNGRGGCPRCNNSFYKAHNEFLQEVSRLAPHLLVRGVYKNAKTKISIECLKHRHQFKSTPNSLLSKHIQCPECIVEKSIQTKLSHSKSVIDPKQKTEYELYRRAVWRYSNRTYKQQLFSQKRDRQNHLDHIVSIMEGFQNQIHPKIMGGVHNLRIISSIDNRTKSYRSEMSPAELLMRYKNA